MDEATKRGVAFLNGAPYGGGILVKGPDTQPKYAYRPAHDAVTRAARAMQEACVLHGVPLSAAALQFSLRDPRVTSTVVGLSDPSRIAATIALGEHPIRQAPVGRASVARPAARGLAELDHRRRAAVRTSASRSRLTQFARRNDSASATTVASSVMPVNVSLVILQHRLGEQHTAHDGRVARTC